MGELVMAAKVTHVPSIWMSEMYEQHKGIRDNAINGLVELGNRARNRGAETFVVIDAHWIVNQGFHLNANERFQGDFTSPELPHFLRDMKYDYPGDPEFGRELAAAIEGAGYRAIAHEDPNLTLEYGTLIPMRHANPDASVKVVPIAANQFASIEEGRKWGEILAQTIKDSDRKVALFASGSLSHQFFPNSESIEGAFEVNKEFNKQVDLRVLELWRDGRTREFLAMLPDYAQRCYGECGMVDTAMLFGLLGWDGYTGKGEQIGDYFGSSGTGQVNVDFDLPA